MSHHGASGGGGDGIDHHDVGEMNAVLRPDHGDPSKGRLVAWRGVHGGATGDERDVFVYLPAAYDDASCPALPVIEFQDGNESLTRAPFHEAADAVYAMAPEAAAILVFVALHAQEERTAEYTFGPGSEGYAYVAFLRDELRPLETARLRTCTAAADRGIAGASLGGLISTYAAFEAPDAWGYVGSQSGSFFWEDGALVARAAEGAVVDVRFYLDHGCPDDNCDSNRDLADALTSHAYELEHSRSPAASTTGPSGRSACPACSSTSARAAPAQRVERMMGCNDRRVIQRRRGRVGMNLRRAPWRQSTRGPGDTGHPRACAGAR